MKFEYIPRGVCSRKFIFDINENNIIDNLEVIGGCNGNLKGISSLVKGLNVSEVIERLSDIRCNQKNTSCPDQIAKALQAYLDA